MKDIKAKWVIDKAIIKDTRYENLANIINDLGYDVSVMEYVPFKNSHDYEVEAKFDFNDCVIVYGTIELVRKLSYYGIFLNEERLQFNSYYGDLGLHHSNYLNDDFIMTPFADFKNNFKKYTDIFNTDALFIRPNSGSKLFTGMSISSINFAHEMNSLQYLSGVTDRSLILISKEKKIYDEVRFIVVGNEIVDGSRYKHKFVKIEDKKYDSSLRELAETVVKCKDKPEELFTIDIASTDNGPKIIELNSFSSAGWYACDPELIVKKASKYVEDKYKEEYNI